jgi:L-gulonate 5-dehydrogenase
MKALVYTAPEALEYRDVPDPEPAQDHHLIRIDSVGICGSDMHAYLGHDDRRPAPLILGHEGAGTVVGGPLDGRRVTINPLVTCGTCRVLPCGAREPLRDAADHLHAAAGRCLRAIRGDAGAQSCRSSGRLRPAPSSTGRARRRQLARRTAGAGGRAPGHARDGACDRRRGHRRRGGDQPQGAGRGGRHAGGTQRDPAQLSRARRGLPRARARGRGGPAIRSCRRCGRLRRHPRGGQRRGPSRRRGPAYRSGRRVRRPRHPPHDLQEITFIGTYTYTAQDFRDTCAAMFDGRLGPLDWTETRPLSEGASAFADIRNGRIAAPKIILKP